MVLNDGSQKLEFVQRLDIYTRVVDPNTEEVAVWVAPRDDLSRDLFKLLTWDSLPDELEDSAGKVRGLAFDWKDPNDSVSSGEGIFKEVEKDITRRLEQEYDLTDALLDNGVHISVELNYCHDPVFLSQTVSQEGFRSSGPEN